MSEKPDHPWWHWFFTSLVCFGMRDNGLVYSDTCTIYHKYKCSKCRKVWVEEEEYT